MGNENKGAKDSGGTPTLVPMVSPEVPSAEELVEAIESESDARVIALLKRGAPVNKRVSLSEGENSDLHGLSESLVAFKQSLSLWSPEELEEKEKAKEEGEEKSEEFTEKCRQKCLKALRQQYGKYPLHVAAMKGAYLAVALLLSGGADVNSPGFSKQLHPAALAAAEGHVEVLRLLLTHGGTPCVEEGGQGSDPISATSAPSAEGLQGLLQQGSASSSSKEKGGKGNKEGERGSGGDGGAGMSLRTLLTAASVLGMAAESDAPVKALGDALFKQTGEDASSQGAEAPVERPSSARQLKTEQQEKKSEEITRSKGGKEKEKGRNSSSGSTGSAKEAREGGDAASSSSSSSSASASVSASNGTSEKKKEIVPPKDKEKEKTKGGKGKGKGKEKGGDKQADRNKEGEGQGKSKNSQLDVQGPKGTPLILSARNGHLDVVTLLISKGANINARTDAGRTALHESASNGHSKVVLALLQAGARTDAKDKENLTPLHLAAQKGSRETVEALWRPGRADMNAFAQNRDMAIHLAVESGSVETVLFLIGAGADINAKGKNDLTPLMVAIVKEKMEVFDALLEKGAAVNIRTQPKLGQKGALHLACAQGHREAVEALTRCKNVDLNLRDKAGCTPLFAAVEKRDASVVEALLAAGADTKAKRQEDGKTAEELAASLGDCDHLISIFSRFRKPQQQQQAAAASANGAEGEASASLCGEASATSAQS